MNTTALPLIYLDANIIIHIVEGHPTRSEEVKALLDALDKATITCMTSELTLAEVLVKPFSSPDRSYRDAYLALLVGKPGLRVVPISRQVLERSAEFRALYGGKLADSIHAATAAVYVCSHFLTEDSRIKLPETIELIALEALPGALLPEPEEPK